AQRRTVIHRGEAFLLSVCVGFIIPMWVAWSLLGTVGTGRLAYEICFDYVKGFWRIKSTEYTCQCGAYSCAHRDTTQNSTAARIPSPSGSKL
ncbi:hypothetical protein BV898_20052, partial [Hypsibius exemplaris]